MLDAIKIGLPLEFIAAQEKVPLEFILGLKALPWAHFSTIHGESLKATPSLG